MFPNVVYYWLSYDFAMAFLYSFAFAVGIILFRFQTSIAAKWGCVYFVLNILIQMVAKESGSFFKNTHT